MIDFILAEANLPFAIALGLMFAIGLLEGVTTLLGAGASDLIESILPFDLDLDADLDMDGAEGVHGLSHLLGWLHLGRVPVLILLVLFLFGFGMAGLAVQSLSLRLFAIVISPWLASVPAFICALLLLRYGGGLLARSLPRDETTAVSEESLIGLEAVITLGRARKGSPAQARLRDRYGQTHYVMVEPEADGMVFETGDPVLLVMRAQGAVFYAMPSPGGGVSDGFP